MTPHHPERGAAFLYVMLIFIAASLLIGGLLGTGYREVDKTERFLNETQAMHYALGAELYARQRLSHNGALWNRSQSLFPVTGGTVGMEIEDLRARFNINSLLATDTQAVTHFKALCTGLGITEKTVSTLLTQLETLKPPPPVDGVAASAPAWMADTSELVDHLLPMGDYVRLAPYITALPLDSHDVNINTASDAVLLAYLDKPEQLSDVHALIKANGSIANDQLQPFQNHDNSFVTDANVYRLHVTVTIGQNPVYLNSVLMHVVDQNQMAAIARTWGE